MTSCLLLAFDVLHGGSFCNLSHSLSTAVCAARIKMALLKGTSVCTKLYVATTEILDLQRDPHVNDFAICEENTCGSPTLQVAFLFSLERVIASLDAKGGAPPSFAAAAFLVGAFAVGLRTCTTRGIAGSTGFYLFFLAFRGMASNSSKLSERIS